MAADEKDELDYLRAWVRYVATDYVELSYDKVTLQRNDYIKHAKKLCEKFEIKAVSISKLIV